MAKNANDADGLVVTAWGVSDVGRRRERNEDSLWWDDDLHLYLVADGMGGHAGGGMASQMAVDIISTLVKSYVEDPDSTAEAGGQGPVSCDPGDILRYAIEQASTQIYQRSLDDSRLRGMGTTVVALWLQGQRAYLANVGDSRGYLLRMGQMLQLTVDHSLVGEQMRAGILSPTDARQHRLKNIITRSVGFQETVEIDVVERSLRQGDLYLLCSDGLTNMIDDKSILQQLGGPDLKAVCQGLVDTANRNGGDDNISLLLARTDHLEGQAGDDPDSTEEWDESTMQTD